jgi:hypothetical protein
LSKHRVRVLFGDVPTCHAVDMLTALFLTAFAQGPSLGVGLLFQGIRPGLLVELPVTLSTREEGDKGVVHSFVPTVSGWVHPGHYVPVQLHGHYMHTQRNRRGLIETSFGIGTTYVANARPTVRLDGDAVRKLPLAGRFTFSPGVGFGAGRTGKKADVLFRVRLNVWLPWQQRVALSGNYELVVRFKKEKGA